MATVAPAADAATSALKVITEMVMSVRLIFRIIEHAPAKRTDTNSDDGLVIARVTVASNYTWPRYSSE